MAQISDLDADYPEWDEFANENPEADAAIDRWHDGAHDALCFKPKASADLDYLAGYKHGERERQVRVVEVERPEGYYHMPLGTFE